MKKIKSLLLSVLALGCLTMASCSLVPKGEDKYTVTLMYNGEVISTMEKDKATHLDAPPAPTKEGYTFKGWFVDEALTVPYTPDLLSANLTLYAKFEANTLYITFNLNGGTMEENKVAVKTGEAYTLPTPTREGYTFAGWTLDGEAFPANGTYEKTGSVRVSASWTKNKYTVTFTDGTATLGTVENVEHGTKVQAWNSPAPGYEVVGIYTDAEMTTAYDFDTPVTGALTLYVKIAPKAFTINTELNGGKVNGAETYSLATKFDAQYTLVAPTKEGYTFAGWTLDGAQFAATGTYKKLTDITVYASWTINKYTVTFTDGTATLATVANVEHGETVQAWNSPEAGYEVVGIYTDAEMTTAYDFDTPVTGALTLYVKIAPKTFTIQVNTNGGSNVNTTAKFGGTYTIATPTRDGHEFRGFLLNGEAFPATGTYTWTTDIVLSVDWYRDPMYQRSTISFYDGTVEIKSITVDDGTALSNLEGAPAKDGYAFDGWYTDANCTTAFVDGMVVNEDIKLYAKYTPNRYVITVNPDNGDAEYTEDVTFGGVYALTAPTKEGYTFKGWKLANGANFDATGTYNTAGDIEVTASWEINRYKVSFMYNGNPVQTLEKVEHGTTVALTYAPQLGYEVAGVYTDEAMTQAYDFNNPVTGALTLYVKVQPKTYTIWVALDGGNVNGQTTYSINVQYNGTYQLEQPTKADHKFEGFKYGNNAFAASGTYTWVENVTVTAVWTKLDADADEKTDETFMNKGNYFKEREDTEGAFTYVFVTGKQYTFDGTTSVTAINAGDAVTQNSATVFTTNKAKGSFTLQVTKVVEGTSITYTRSAKIVDQVTAFEGGADYNTVWGASVANRSVNFLQVKEDAVMAVGASNFKPDLKADTLNSQALSQDAAYLQVTATVGGVPTTAFTYVNGVITFDASLIGQTVTLQFAPKYSLTGTKHTVTVTVNDGVNVYTNDDLRLAYGDHSTNTINVLRNIKAALGSGALNPDGTPINAYQYGVYVRNVANPNDQMVINGNFFGIDGSQLPILKGPYQDSDPTVALTDVQTGIFLYKNGNGTSIANGYHSGQVTFNDLFITGNYTMPSNTYEPMSGYDTGFLVAGGTYLGLVLEGGTMNVNNTTVTNSNIAVLMRGGVSTADATQQAAQLNLNYAKFDNAFNNSIYAWNTSKVDIKNSELSNAGGALIHFDDLARPENVVSSLNMDTASKFTNWITGMEAYWTCRTGMSTLALGMKTTIEGMISEASKLPVPSEHPLYGQPLLTTLDSTGQKFNLVMLVQSAGGNADEWLYTDPQKMPMVNIQANTMTPTTPATSVPALLMNGQTFLQFDTAGLGQVNDQYRMGLLEVCSTIPLDLLLQYFG